MDLGLSLALLGVAVFLAAAYGLRLAVRGRSRSARVDAEGKSAVLGKGVLEMLYWGVTPIAASLASVGISADVVTWVSLVLGLGAGVLLGAGHFGAGAFVATVAAACDAIDGFIARVTGTSSDAGELLDAAIDRYVDLAFLAGIAVAFRGSVPLLVLTIAAIAASFMVSYATAKAEALGIEAPRGSMRRTERAVILVVGATLTPIAAALPIGEAWHTAPIVVAVAVVAVFGNISAVARLASIRAGLRRRALAAAPHTLKSEIAPIASEVAAKPATR